MSKVPNSTFKGGVCGNALWHHEKGFWENWYSRSKFEDFVGELPVSRFRNIKTVGTSRQTAEIYVLDKV